LFLFSGLFDLSGWGCVVAALMSMHITIVVATT
jgi:hypothetical protein